jgi:NADH:ubiquinone oxidoreductase subunit E
MCLGTACHERGAPNLLNYVENRFNINDGETTPDNKFTLETVRCLGACAIAPVIMIDGKAHGRMTQRKMNRLLTRLEKEHKEVQDIGDEGN